MKAILVVLLGFLFAQEVVKLGSGSYASYPPESVWDDDFYGTNYRMLKAKYPNLFVIDTGVERPIPTNHWFTNFFFNQFGGTAWAFPHAIEANNQGINVLIPVGFNNGDMITNPGLSIRGTTEIQATDDILFTNFEGDTFPPGWIASADFPYPGPITLAVANQTPNPAGFSGTHFVDTFKGNEATGTVISPTFTIEKQYIHLVVGGGNYPDNAYVGLFVNNERVFSETGTNGASLTPRTWNVTALIGQKAEIRIVDSTGAGWGFIMVDEIVFSNNEHGGGAFDNNFKPVSSAVLDWSDIAYTFREQDPNGYIDTTVVHGVPFVYFEFNQVYPILHPGQVATFYDVAGEEILEFPVAAPAITLEYGGRVYGLHIPTGASFIKSGSGDLELSFPPTSAKYLVVSDLPSRQFLKEYDLFARNKPTNTIFTYDYVIPKGQISTTFTFETKNLETGALNGPVLQTFMPHHYRTTTQSFEFIVGATYTTIHGISKTGAPSLSFTLTYEFGGFPPYLPKPLDLTPQQDDNLAQLIKKNAQDSAGFDGNTYAKGLGEKTSIMLQAFSRGAQDDADQIRANLKNQYANWLNYDPAEAKQYFFSMYPEYGALIGWPSGYGSQGFNDLHFHYGYFVVGAARVMLLDQEFKEQYGPIVKYLAQDYVNYKHYDPTQPKSTENPFFPFLRTFDAYEGHSYAGGTGDGGGNNQESTSEAVNSWWGVYVLGIALNDPELIKLGAVGYKLETTAAGEYWLDLYNDNFPDTYKHEFVGIERSGALAFATYFSGDPGWVLGIQGVPCDFYYQPYGYIKENMQRVWEAMLQERIGESGTTDAYANIQQMDPYLGGYHLNLLSTYDPVTAVGFLDRLYASGGGWTNHVNIATITYVAHAYITYGRPAPGYSTSVAGGAVFVNEAGTLTYLLYNNLDTAQDILVFQNGATVATINVPAHTLYNSQDK